MKPYTCLCCGTVFQSDRFRKYCSNRCNQRYWQRNRRAGVVAPLQHECVMNEGVVCTEHSCDTCGWNPKIARKRLAVIKDQACCPAELEWRG